MQSNNFVMNDINIYYYVKIKLKKINEICKIKNNNYIFLINV